MIDCAAVAARDHTLSSPEIARATIRAFVLSRDSGRRARSTRRRSNEPTDTRRARSLCRRALDRPRPRTSASNNDVSNASLARLRALLRARRHLVRAKWMAAITGYAPRFNDRLRISSAPFRRFAFATIEQKFGILREHGESHLGTIDVSSDEKTIIGQNYSFALLRNFECVIIVCRSLLYKMILTRIVIEPVRRAYVTELNSLSPNLHSQYFTSRDRNAHSGQPGCRKDEGRTSSHLFGRTLLASFCANASRKGRRIAALFYRDNEPLGAVRRRVYQIPWQTRGPRVLNAS